MKKKREKKNLSNLALFRMTWPNLWRTAPWYVILSTLLGVVFSLIGAVPYLERRHAAALRKMQRPQFRG